MNAAQGGDAPGVAPQRISRVCVSALDECGEL